jgi:sugar-specific transcriptional regulator TrmB
LNSDDKPNEQILTLTELGLTSTQAKIYFALAKSSNLTANAIAGLSSVSRPDVYRILNQLQENGLVEKIIAKPEEFRAIPIEECVSLLLQRRIKKTQNLQSRGLKLVQSMKKTESVQSTQGSKVEFVFIPSKRTAYVRSERMLAGLKKSLLFVGSTTSMSAWLTEYYSGMEAALVKGIDCRMILPKTGLSNLKDPFNTLKKYPNFKLERIDGFPKASFSIWDKIEMLITTSSYNDPVPPATLWSNNKNLIDLCADYFDCLWQKSEDSKS